VVEGEGVGAGGRVDTSLISSSRRRIILSSTRVLALSHSCSKGHSTTPQGCAAERAGAGSEELQPISAETKSRSGAAAAAKASR
jgi:hypothetical protein